MKILYLPNEFSQQRQKEKRRWIYPVRLAMEAQHYRNTGHTVFWDDPTVSADKIIVEPENINFLNLPYPDRIFTNAFAKKYQGNGNFKYHPGTYIQVANGCWHGKCVFCVEQGRKQQVREPWHVHQELSEIKRLGFREVFDDSGTFPIGSWLDEFLRTPHPGLTFGCNMRMVDIDYARMKRYGFRMMLFGIESANQGTLDRINKVVRIEDIKWIEKAHQSGIDCHGAVMFGYPWECDGEALRTLKLVQSLLRCGILKTAQASFYKVSGQDSRSDHHRFVRKIYNVCWSPQFWFHKIKDTKTIDDLKYLWRQIKEGMRHDYRN